MSSGEWLVAVILLGIVVLLAVQTVAYFRGGFDSAFFRRTMEERLDGIAANRREWAIVGVLAVALTVAVAGGVVGFARHVAVRGGLTLTTVSAGLVLVASAAWLVGIAIEGGVVPLAARERADTGTTPAWIEPFWTALYHLEIVYVVVANVAYVLLGLAVVRVGYPSVWSGWASIVIAGAVLGYALITREIFPQLALFVPVLLGVAVVLA